MRSSRDICRCGFNKKFTASTYFFGGGGVNGKTHHLLPRFELKRRRARYVTLVKLALTLMQKTTPLPPILLGFGIWVLMFGGYGSGFRFAGVALMENRIFLTGFMGLGFRFAGVTL